MGKMKDTVIAMQFRKETIRNNISIDNCKECTFLDIKDKNLQCLNDNPHMENCNLLKIFRIN